MNEIDADKNKTLQMAKMEVKDFCHNYKNLQKSDITEFLNCYFVAQCAKHNYNIPLIFRKDKEIPEGGYNVEEDAVIYNTDAINKAKIDVESTKVTGLGSVVSLMFTLNHELRHKQQCSEIQVDFNNAPNKIAKINPNSILFAKEILATENYGAFCELYGSSIDENNYAVNYNHVLFETDANLNAFKQTYKDLCEFNGELAEKFYKNNIIKAKVWEDEVKHPNKIKHIDLEVDDQLITAQFKYAKMCDDIIKNNPQKLKEFPILNFLYHADGTKKRYAELVLDIEKLNTELQTANYDLLKTVVNNDPLLMYDVLLSDIENSDCANYEVVRVNNSFAEALVSRASEYDDRYYESFRSLTQEAIGKQLAQLENTNPLGNEQVSQKLSFINKTFNRILQANAQMQKQDELHKKQVLDAKKLISRVFNIDVDDTLIKVDENTMYGKLKYDRQALNKMLEQRADDFSKSEYDGIFNAIKLVRETESNSLQAPENTVATQDNEFEKNK